MMRSCTAGTFARCGMLLIVAAISAPTFARDIHVSPTGTAEGDGSAAKPYDLLTVIGGKGPARPGDTVLLAEGVYEGPMKDAKTRLPFVFEVAGTPGTPAQPIRFQPAPGAWAHLNGTITVKGDALHLVNLEIGDLKWDPTHQTHVNDTAATFLGGRQVKMINCNVFGGNMGTGAWSPAVDLEIYGTLIHDFGYFDKDPKGRGHGHAFYAQNEQGTKLFANNIAYRGCGWNVHVYTQGGQIVGFDIVDNICYIAGVLRENQTTDNMLVAGYVPADRIHVRGNTFYQSRHSDAWRPNARMSTYKAPLNGEGSFTDNVVIGANKGLLLSAWKTITVTGNTIWAHSDLIDMPKPADNAKYVIDGNTYHASGKAGGFLVNDVGELAFDDWRKLGFDGAGKFHASSSGPPAVTITRVYPNKYEQGRANVAVYDHTGAKSVAVDLSAALKPGQKFAVYNCLDIRQTIRHAKPVIEATYESGKPVSLPLRRDEVSPDFDAFLVLPR